MKPVVLLALAPAAGWAHATMNNPPARNTANRPSTGPDSCSRGACMWFNQGCSIGCACNEDNALADFTKDFCGSGMEPTVNDPKYRTFNIHNDKSPGVPGWPKDWTKFHPWRSPGTAKPLDPCGLSGGSTKNNDVAGGFGKDTIAGKQGVKGSSLPKNANGMKYTAGEVVEMAWTIAANHGGGYQWRICPEPSNGVVTEECFDKRPLEFVGDTQWLQWLNGTKLAIPATRVSEGVSPKGSTWTKNPIPPCDGLSGGFKGEECFNADGSPNYAFQPPAGCDETCWGYQACYPGEFPDQPCPGPIKTVEIPQIVDKVRIPADLPAGDYVVQWRWDCEHTPQVWNSCGDVSIVERDPAMADDNSAGI